MQNRKRSCPVVSLKCQWPNEKAEAFYYYYYYFSLEAWCKACMKNPYSLQALETWVGTVYLQSMIMVRVSLSLASWKGGCPHTSMKRITPRLQISTGKRTEMQNSTNNYNNNIKQKEEKAILCFFGVWEKSRQLPTSCHCHESATNFLMILNQVNAG